VSRASPAAAVAVAVVLAFAPALALAQTRATTADLTGFVRDESGGVVPGVVIIASDSVGGAIRTSMTGEDGRFSMPALPVGTYTIGAELSGFVVEALDEVGLAVGSAVDVSIVLRVGSIAEQVTVAAAESSSVDIQKTAVASAVSQEQIDRLPINGRNFISFALLTPGVTIDRGPNQGAAATSGLVFAGQRARSNNITVDGLDNNDSTVGSVRATFSQEAIREFQVLTSGYSAEFGKAAGGVLNIVTRSGTNALAGNTFLYFRDKTLNAKAHFERFTPSGDLIEREKAPYSQRQFGATVGGPLKRDRTFFFLSFERRDIDATEFVTIDDTTLVADPAGGPPLGTPAGVLRQAGFRIDTGHVPLALTDNQFLGKVDHHVTSGQQLAMRFSYATMLNEQIEPWGGLVAKSRGAVLDAADYAIAATHTFVRGKNLVNEARVQYAVRDQAVDALDPNCPLPCRGEEQGGPAVGVSGVGSVGRQVYTPAPRDARRIQAIDTVTYYAGKHQVKAGFDASVIDTEARLPLGFGGEFAFTALPAIPGLTSGPISAIQAVALGLPTVYFRGYGNPDADYPYSDLSVFVLDEWSLSSALTVKLGVRYQAQFWPDGFPRDRNDVAPRLSAAWDPFGARKTVIRGAYGLFYDNTLGTIAANTKALNGTTGVRSVVAILPSLVPVEAWNAPGRRVDTPPENVPSVVVSVDPRLKTPYTHHAAIGLDHEAGGVLLSATLMHVRGFNFLGPLEYNPLLTDLGPGRRPDDVDGVAGTSTTISQYTSYGQTWYRGLILSASKRRGPYQVLASYTLSKAEDNSTDYIGQPEHSGRGRNPADPDGLPLDFDPNRERARSVHDQRHRFVASGIAMLPGDLQVASIATVASGRAYDLFAGFDFNRDGTVNDRPRRDPSSAPLDRSSAVARNTGMMPGEVSVDLRVQKGISLAGRARADAIVELFNLFNRTNFTHANPVFGPGVYPHDPLPSFGDFTEAAPPRQVQVALKVSF
jgi:hypothetical protein